MDLRKICTGIQEAAHEAGSFIMEEAGKTNIGIADIKGFHDFVTYVDKTSEEMLVERLGKLIPGAGFITEEGTSSKEGINHVWIIDPLDGTTNFLHGIHPFSISIALKEGDEIVAGLVYEPGYNETFTAWKGGGTWLNGKSVRVSESARPDDCILATGFPYKDFSRLDAYMKCLGYFITNMHGVRRLGSAAIDLAYVACGRFDAFFEYGLNPWDVSAGIILVREAGGCTSDFSGNKKEIGGSEIVAANSMIFPVILENVRKFMHH